MAGLVAHPVEEIDAATPPASDASGINRLFHPLTINVKGVVLEEPLTTSLTQLLPFLAAAEELFKAFSQ